MVIDFDEVKGNNNIVAELTFIVKPDVILGDKCNNNAYLTAGSMPDNRHDETRYYYDNDTFNFNTFTYFDVEKVVINTSSSNIVNVSYGEIINYAINMTVPKGFVNITIFDTLPEGIDLIDGSLILSDGTILTNDNYTFNNRQLNIALNLVVTQTPLVIYYNAYVLKDEIKNPIGQNKINTAIVTWFENITSSANVIIVAPNVTITKNYNVTIVEGSDEVSLIINATNTGNSILYNATIADDLSDLINNFVNKDDLQISIIEGNETGKLIKNWNGNVLRFYLEKLSAGKSIVVNITFNIISDVNIGINHTNDVNVIGYSVVNGVDNQIKDYVANATDGFDTKCLEMNKTVYSTDVINNKTHVSIGEEIVYKINATIAIGSYDSIILEDVLPDGFRLVDGSIKIYKDDSILETDGYDVDYVDNVVRISFSNDFAQDVIYTFNGRFSVYLTVVVLDDDVNTRGIVKTNDATYSWNNLKHISDNAQITIVEPGISVVKDVNSTIVEGGDSVSYTVNVTATGNYILYNVTVLENLTNFVGLFVKENDDVHVLINGIENHDNITWNNKVLTIYLGDMVPGEVNNITLKFTIRTDVLISSTFTNVAVANGYSVPNLASEARIYSASAGTESVKVKTKNPSINNTIIGTNITKSVKNVTIGDRVYYLINVTLPNGNYTHLTITDVLPDGFEYISAFDNGGVIENISLNGQTIEITYVNFDSYSYGGHLLINLTVLVKDDDINKLGDVKNNKVNLSYEGNNYTSNSNITIVEPIVSVTKIVNNTIVEGNDNVYYEITVTNAGNSALYNISILDDLSKFIGVFVESNYDISILIDNVTANPNEYNWINNKLNVSLNTMDSNAVKKIKLVFKVKSDVHIGDNFTNNVDVSGYSIPISNDEPRIYTNNANSQLMTTAKPSIAKYVNKTGVNNNLKNFTIGETIDYIINITLPIGKYTNITVVDELPEGLSYVSAHYLNGTDVPIKSISLNKRTILINYVDVLSNNFDGYLVINLTAFVENVSANKNGTSKLNNVTYYINDKYMESTNASVIIIEPNIKITKSSDKSKYNVTEKVEYTIEIENIGTATAYNVNITDIIEEGLIFTDEYYIDNSWTVNFNSTTKTIIIAGNELSVKDKVKLVFNCTFNQTLDNILGKYINNSANVYYTSINCNGNRTYSNSTTVDVYVVVCDLSVVKVATSEIFAGNDVTYTITVKNNGPDTAYNVILKDLFDEKYLLNVHYSLDETNWNNYVGTISLGSFTSGKTQNVYIKALLNASSLGVLNNSVVVSTTVNESNYDNNKDVNLTFIIANTELNVYKEDNITGDGVVAGTDIEYTITVENIGPATAFNVTLSDYFDITQLHNMEYSTDKVTWLGYTNATVISLGDMLPNDKLTLYFKALVNAYSRGNIVNVASITTDTENIGINSTIKVTPIITDNDLIITKYANVESINPGEYLSYVIKVTATGHSNSINVNLEDVLDTNLLDTSYAIYTLNDVSKGSWTGSIYYGNMAPGDSFTIIITGIKVKRSADKDIYNEAKVYSDEITNGKSGEVEVHLKIVDLAVTKTTNVSNGFVNLFDEFVYYINVTNYGPDLSENINAIDLIDKGLIIKDVKSSLGTVYDNVSGVWTIGSLDSGESVTLNITCKINKTGIITNNVVVTGTGYDINEFNNKDVVDVYVGEYTITKSSENISYINNEITYVIEVKNTKDIAGFNIKVVDEWENGKFEFVVADNDGINNSNKCSWIIPSIDAGESKTLRITLKVLVNGTLSNNATVNNVTAIKNIIVPEVSVVKSSNVTVNPNYGDLVEFYIKVSNDFDVAARNVSVLDVLPDGLEFVYADHEGFNSSLHDVAWNLDLNANSVVILKVVARVVGYGNLTNVVFVNDNNGKYDNKTGSSSVFVPYYDIVIESPDSVARYNNVTYTITVTNTNNIDGYNVIVTDSWIKEQLGGSGNYTWTIGNITAGNTVVLHITLTALVNGTIINNVSVNNVSDSKNIIVPEVSVVKSSNVTVNPNYGDLVEFYIKVSNDFDVAARNVSVLDVLPDGLEFVYADHEGFNSSLHDVAWNLDLNANSVVILKVVARVVGYGNLTNVVFVNDNNGKYDNKTDNTSVIIPKYNIIKVADDINKVYSIGEYVTYTIIVTNINNVTGYDIVITDKFDKRLEFINSTGPNEDKTDIENNEIHWMFNTFGNSSVMTFNVTFKVIGYGIIHNEASVNNIFANENITIVDLIVNKTTVDEIVNYNGTAVFIINVTNPTDGIARNVKIMEIFGEGLEYVDSNLTINRTVDANKVYWVVNVPSEGLLIKVYANVNEYGVLNNTVFVDDHNGVKNSTSLVKVAKYDINKEATDINNTYSCGEVIVYEITVNNTNNLSGKNIIVSDNFNNSQLEFIGSTGPNEDSTDKSKGIIKWIIPSIANGDIYKFNVSFVVKSHENTSISNNASVNNVNVSEMIDVVGVNVKITNVTNPNFGELISFEIIIENPHNTEIRNVTIKEILSSGLEFISTNYTSGFNNITNSWNNLTIGPNGLIIKVIANVTDYGYLNNTVSINDNNGVADNKVAAVKVAVPEISINKESIDKNYYIGDEIVYHITVVGDNEIDGSQVVVTDYLPIELTNIQTDGIYDNENHLIKWIIDVPSGKTINLTVKGIFKGIGLIDNKVSVGNYTANKTVEVYDIIPIKVANVTDINVGQMINYTINLTNVGNLDAVNVNVKDLIPKGLEIINITNHGKLDGDYIIWSITIPAKSTISLNVIVKVLESVELNNTVFVANKNSSNILYSKDFTIDKIAQNKTAVYLYDNIEYHVIIINTGNFDLINKTITDILPENLKFVSASNGGIFVNGEVVWNNISVGINKTLILNITCQIVKEGTITNVITADEKITNDTVRVDYICDLDITIDVPKGPVKVGEPFDVIITVNNYGPSVARDVIVHYKIKGNYKLSKYDVSKGKFSDVWNIGDLDCNETVVLKLTLIPTSSGYITISANVSASINETEHVNNNASATVSVKDNNNNNSGYHPSGHEIKKIMHDTGNPVFALLAVFLCASILVIKRKK